MKPRKSTSPVLAVVIALLALLLVGGAVASTGPASATVAGRGVTVSAPAHVKAGSGISIRGTIATQPSRGRRVARVVRLEERVGGRWVSRATKRSTRSGSFRFVVGAGRKRATRVFRVVSGRARSLKPARTAAVRVAVATAAPSAGASHYSVNRDWDGKVVRWAACNAIPYYLNMAGAPAGWRAVVARVVAKVSAGTGYAFAYRGTTTYLPKELQNAIVIAWSDARHTPELDGPTAGLGGQTWSDGLVIAGGVWMDKTLLSWGGSTHTALRAKVIEEIFLHEMGHVMGLQHVSDRRQVMYPTAFGDFLSYQAGDLNGLRAVGRSAGACRRLDAPKPWPTGAERVAVPRRSSIVG